MSRIRLLSLICSLFLTGCIQDADLEKLKLKRADDWLYSSITDSDGHIDSVSMMEFKADETGIMVHVAIQCVHGSSLELLISPFQGPGMQPAPIKMRYARSAAFGKFRVADIKAENHHVKFTLTAHVDAEANRLRIYMDSSEKSLKGKLSSPNLTLSIPLVNSSRVIIINLSNQNIAKVLNDCNFKTAFMMARLSNY